MQRKIGKGCSHVRNSWFFFGGNLYITDIFQAQLCHLIWTACSWSCTYRSLQIINIFSRPKSRSLGSPFLKRCKPRLTPPTTESFISCGVQREEKEPAATGQPGQEYKPTNYQLQHINCTYQRRLQWLWPSWWVKQNLDVSLRSTEKEEKSTSGCIRRYHRWYCNSGGRGTVHSSLTFHNPHMLRPLLMLCRAADVPRGDGVWAVALPWANFLLLSKICLLPQETKISFYILISETSGSRGHDGYGQALTAIQVHSLLF